MTSRPTYQKRPQLNFTPSSPLPFCSPCVVPATACPLTQSPTFPPIALPSLTSPATSVPSATAAPQVPTTSPPTQPTPPGPSDPDSRFAEIDGVIVHHKVFAADAPTSAPVAICFHGFGASLFSFELCPQLRRFATVVAYDAPGFGSTSRPSSLKYYTPFFSARAAYSLALAYNQNSKPFVLIAHSLGCLAAASLCVRCPQQIKAVVLIAPALLPPSSRTPEAEPMGFKLGRWLLTALSQFTKLLTPLLIPLFRAIVTPRSFWKRGLSLARTAPVPEHVIDGYRRPITAPGWERGFINFVRAALHERARDPQSNEYIDLTAALASIGHAAPPILIVHGDSDNLVPLQNSNTLKQSLPTASLITVTGSGHVPHEEFPGQFASIVEGFLGELPN